MTARHAVVVSWHATPDPRDADPMLGLWAEPLAAALAAAGWRVTRLVPVAALPPGAPPPGTLYAAGASLPERAGALADALALLAPQVVHAPERRGLLAAMLSRRAAGLGHGATRVVLHARGPLFMRLAEAARFIPGPEALVEDALERQAMCLADALVTACPAVAAALPGARLVAALHPQVLPVAQAAPRELVFPLPFTSEAGLEFAVAALARARTPLPVLFLGEPGAVTAGDAARVLAGLGPGVDWRIEAAGAAQALQSVAAPGRVALCTAQAAPPPELAACCAAAGVPLLLTDSPAAREAAARWPGTVRLLPRAERAAAAVLSRLPQLPAAAVARPMPALPPPPFDVPGRPATLAAALIEETEAPVLTLFAPCTPGIAASLSGQTLAAFATVLGQAAGTSGHAACAGGPAAGGAGGEPATGNSGGWPEAEALPPGTPRRPIARLAAPLPEALAGCATRYAVLAGADALHPEALRALLRFARATGAPAITAWDSATRPSGGDAAMALLCPQALLGHLVLLDLPALRASGGQSLAAAGTPRFAAVLAAEAGGVAAGVAALGATLATAAAPPAWAPMAAPGLLPSPLAGVARLALFEAAAPPACEDALHAALAAAPRGGGDHFKLLGRLLERHGAAAAALDAWQAALALMPDDAEAIDATATLGLVLHGRLPRHPPAGAAPRFAAALLEQAARSLDDADAPRAQALLAALLAALPEGAGAGGARLRARLGAQMQPPTPP